MQSPRLYSDLAFLWPLWGELEIEYGPHAAWLAERLRAAARREIHDVLVLSCGEGKTIYHFKKDWAVTGVDLSPAMLERARALNPECEFVPGDMREFERPAAFDAVFVDDGVAYLTERADLDRLFACVHRSLRPGGAVLVGVDALRETFVSGRSALSQSTPERARENLEVVFVENDYDPDPADDWFESLFIYIIRENGRLRVEQDLHRMGLFSRSVWQATLAEAGFAVDEVEFEQEDERTANFIGVKAGGSPGG